MSSRGGGPYLYNIELNSVYKKHSFNEEMQSIVYYVLFYNFDIIIENDNIYLYESDNTKYKIANIKSLGYGYMNVIFINELEIEKIMHRY